MKKLEGEKWKNRFSSERARAERDAKDSNYKLNKEKIESYQNCLDSAIARIYIFNSIQDNDSVFNKFTKKDFIERLQSIKDKVVNSSHLRYTPSCLKYVNKEKNKLIKSIIKELK